MSKKESESGPYEKEIVLCSTCGEREATHEISISCQKGLLWWPIERRQGIFHVSYIVCGECAREMVEVKLNATLKKR